MSNVEFEGGFKRSNRSGKTTATGRMFMKLSGGVIKNQQQANKAILVATLLIFVATLYLIFK